MTQNLRIPVTGAAWAVTDVGNDSNIVFQTAVIDNRTLQLPLLYLNSFGMNTTQVAAAKAALANQATHELLFQVTLPPVGFGTFKVVPAHMTASAVQANMLTKSRPRGSATNAKAATTGTISNGFYSVAYDSAAGTITAVTNTHSNVSTSFAIDWGFYKSSEGGCTGGVNATTGKWVYDMYGCDGQASGAYMFRPNTTDLHPCSATAPTLEVFNGEWCECKEPLRAENLLGNRVV